MTTQFENARSSPTICPLDLTPEVHLPISVVPFNICLIYLDSTGLPWWLSIKNLLAMQEMQVRSLDWEDPLEKEMATHSSILAWGMPWTEEGAGPQFMGS